MKLYIKALVEALFDDYDDIIQPADETEGDISDLLLLKVDDIIEEILTKGKVTLLQYNILKNSYYKCYDTPVLKAIIQALYHSNISDIIDLNWIDVSYMRSFKSIFSDLRNEKKLFLVNSWDTSNVCDMSGLLLYSAVQIDISNWDVSNVINFMGTFYRYTFHDDFNISEWSLNTNGQAINMEYMFAYTELPDKFNINNWNTIAVYNMKFMFYSTYINNSLDLSNWKVDNVTTMDHMFTDADNITDKLNIGDWNVENVKCFRLMFEHTSMDINLDNWKISSLADASYMFNKCPLLDRYGIDAILHPSLKNT